MAVLLAVMTGCMAEQEVLVPETSTYTLTIPAT